MAPNVSYFEPETRCAEIYYYSSNFTIKCASCQEIFLSSYPEFTRHFQAAHLKNVPATICVKAENNMPLIEANEELHDHCEKYSEGDQSSDNVVVNSSEDFINMDSYNIGNNIVEVEVLPGDIDWSETYAPNLLNRKQKRPYKPRNQPNCCNYCGKTFRRRYQLDTHLNIHTGLKPHQCEFCGRQFRAINTLQRHLNTHGKRETFTCKYCSKQFTHKAAYVSHETRHTQERQFPCKDCGKIFYTPNQLDTHKRKIHKEDNNLPFVCDHCPKSYRSASMLSTHKLKKHYRTAKYACEQCGKKFVEILQLNKHRSIHIIKESPCI